MTRLQTRSVIKANGGRLPCIVCLSELKMVLAVITVKENIALEESLLQDSIFTSECTKVREKFFD